MHRSTPRCSSKCSEPRAGAETLMCCAQPMANKAHNLLSSNTNASTAAVNSAGFLISICKPVKWRMSAHFLHPAAGFISDCHKYKAAALLSRIGHLKTALARNSRHRSLVFHFKLPRKCKSLYSPRWIRWNLFSSPLSCAAACNAPCFFCIGRLAQQHVSTFYCWFLGEQFNFKRGEGLLPGGRLECIEKWSRKGKKCAKPCLNIDCDQVLYALQA